MWFQDYAATQLKLISSKIGAKYFTVLPMKVKNPASLLIKDFMFECVLKKAKTRKGDIFWQNWVRKGAPTPPKEIREKFLYFELVIHRLSVQCRVKVSLRKPMGCLLLPHLLPQGLHKGRHLIIQLNSFNSSSFFYYSGLQANILYWLYKLLKLEKRKKHSSKDTLMFIAACSHSEIRVFFSCQSAKLWKK